MAASKHPNVAIGGVNEQNIACVMETGTNGIAVISAICMQSDPGNAAKTLRQIVNRYK